MKKLDLFKADKMMSERVADFMQKKIWGITLKARCKIEMQTLEDAIKGYEKLEGSILIDDAPRLISEAQNEIARLKSVLAEQLKDEATFSFTDNDKDLYKLYKDGNAIDGVRAWFKVYGLEVDNTELEKNILDAIGGKKRSSAKTIINSGATKFNDNLRTKTDILGLFYGELSEAMLKVGTLKPSAIQDDVRKFYAPKKKNA